MGVGQGSAPSQQIAAFRSDGVTAATGLRIPFFTDSFSRAFGFPETRLRNMISEATPLREERPYVPLVGLRDVHYGRPGLVAGTNLGAGPIRCVFQAPPALGGFIIEVSGGAAFNAATGAPLGPIPGSDMVRWAVSRAQIVLVSSGVAYLYDATTSGQFQVLSDSVLPPVLDVVFLGGRFVYAIVGSDTFYWSDINNAASVDGLSFATAEAYPDSNAALAILNGELLIFGTNSLETWDVGTDSNAPFTPVEGRGYQRGCAARDAIAFCDNALFWIGNNRVVYRTQDVPFRVSSSSIEDKLRQCADIAGCTGFTVTFEGHEFYVLNIAGIGTYAYDSSRIGTATGAYGNSYERGEWGEWTSFSRRQFRGGCALSNLGAVWVGDDTTNDLWAMQVGSYCDGADPLIRSASAFIKVEEGTPRCDNLVLHCAVGVGNPVGSASQPVVEMRHSDDQGRTFADWRPATLGAQGAYTRRAYWQRLGQMRAPGRLVEIRASDPVDVAFSHLELNAARPGS